MKIILTEEVHKKIMHWVNKSKYEVSGLGTIKVEPNGVIRVVSAMLLPQTNGATHTDIEADAVCKAMYELRDAEGELKFWWHSHVMMNVFWSGTDMATIKEFGEHDWIIATVFNQKNEMKSAFYDKKGLKTPWGEDGLFFDNVETSIAQTPDPRVAQWDEEYAKNVKNAEFPMVQKDITPQTKHLPEAVDEYGYDSWDWELLTECDYALADIESLLEAGYTPAEVLVLAEAGITYATVLHCQAEGFNREEVLKQARATYLDTYDWRGYDY